VTCVCPAQRVSSAVNEQLRAAPRPARVVARGPGALHLDADGFVVTILGRRVPLLPNAVAVSTILDEPGWPRTGETIWLASGRIRARDREVIWDARQPPLWDPCVRRPAHADPASVAALSEVVLDCLELTAPSTGSAAESLFGPDDEDGHEGLVELLRSVRYHDAVAARRAALLLTGRGPGLTPSGDDLLAGAGATVAALGNALGFPRARQLAWRAALVLPDLAARTTAVSATLLRLAARGLAVEPLHGLLDPGLPLGHTTRSLSRLRRLGHSTGWACAAAAGLCLAELAAAAQAAPTTKEYA
jgi:hypothetical protein